MRIRFWSYRGHWKNVGDFGGIILPLEEALWTKSPQTRFSGHGREQILYKVELRLRRRKASRRSKNHDTHRCTSSGPERSLNRLAVVRGRKGTEKKFEANDVMFREIRFGHSSCETYEQGVATPCGVGGVKGRSEGESGRLKDAPFSV